MIRINLLPQKRNRRQEAVQAELSLVGVGAGVLVAVLLVVHLLSVGRATNIRADNATLQVDINQKQTIVEEIEKAKVAHEDLTQRLDVIKQLKANKSGPVRMLDELAMSTPDKLQLTSLISEGGDIELKGISVSHEMIGQFLTRLEESDYFTDVLLIEIDQTEVDGTKLKSFEVKCRFLVSGSMDEDEDEDEVEDDAPARGKAKLGGMPGGLAPPGGN